jgi:hypothetical protein
MKHFYGGPSIDTSYQVSVHLARRFQRRRLKCEKLTDDGRQVMAILSRSKNLTFAKTVNISAKPPLLIHILPPFNI